MIDASSVRATIHPACHVYKMVPEDVIYDDTVLDGNRVAVSTGLMQALGTQVIDYKTWYDCCGFGFRHIISEREFSRSFAIDRKIKVAVEEAQSDVMIGHDTGCITTLDKNQWIGRAARQAVRIAGHGRLPVCSAASAAPIRTASCRRTGTRRRSRRCLKNSASIGSAKKAAFEAYLKEIQAGKTPDQLYDPRLRLTSGPGFKPIKREVIPPPPAE